MSYKTKQINWSNRNLPNISCLPSTFVFDWTIGGLVAGSILAKSGFFAKLGVLLLKFWKIIAVGAVAIAAGIKKIFGSKKA